MLVNNNRKVISKLAKCSLTGNRKKSGIIFVAVLLATFLLFSVLTVGVTYFEMQHLQNIRLDGGDQDAMLVNGFSEQQRKICKEFADIVTVGTVAYAGYAVETAEDDTLHSGMLWSDKNQWKKS